MADLPKGGTYLFRQTDPQSIFTPEDFSDEHKMIYRTALGFVNDKVLTVIDDLDNKKEGLNSELLLAAGELGLLGTDVPEEYDGYAMDKISTCIIAECMGRAGGFAMTHGGQTGIGQLPIVYFGTHEQKLKYLPGIVSGEKGTAYALTEPGAGSDALAAKACERPILISCIPKTWCGSPCAESIICFSSSRSMSETIFSSVHMLRIPLKLVLKTLP